MTSFLVLQLADAAFPSGGFAHSGGLEAFAAFSPAASLDAFYMHALRSAARQSLPFVRAACESPERLSALDALADATLTSHVQNRASRAQGRALASAAARIFPSVTSCEAHHAPAYGALAGQLGISPRDACASFLHGVARGVLSAGVRLGLAGPLEAQRLLAESAPLLDAILESSLRREPSGVATSAPLVELFGALHDELDGRLFQS